MTSIGLAGYLVRHPLGGMAWTFAQYLAGLQALDADAFFIEDAGWEQSCYDPTTGRYGDDPTAGLRLVRGLLGQLGIDLPVFFIDIHGQVHGGPADDLARRLRHCELLVDVGGVCTRPRLAEVARRALVDLDPAFTQAGRFGGDQLSRYDVHFTYGVNIGRPDCPIPDRGLCWLPTVPPVVPEAWVNDTPPAAGAAFTTIASWNAYGTVSIDGLELGQKDRQIRRLLDLPRRSGQALELALAGGPPDAVAELRTHGWRVSEASRLDDPWAYRDFILRSAGELGVAKHGYVATGSGWFSDRTVAYLAAGRPAVVEDTGIGATLPLGEGLLTFTDVESAAAALDLVNSDPVRHQRAATQLARERFDACDVVRSLVERALAAGS